MTAKAFFENTHTRCRIVVTHDNGHVDNKDFNKVGQLVAYCNEHGIDITIGACQPVEELPDFDCKEED